MVPHGLRRQRWQRTVVHGCWATVGRAIPPHGIIAPPPASTHPVQLDANHVLVRRQTSMCMMAPYPPAVHAPSKKCPDLTPWCNRLPCARPRPGCITKPLTASKQHTHGAPRRSPTVLRCYASQSHGASQTHRPFWMRAQNGTAGSLEVAVTMGHAAGGQNAVEGSSPGQHG